MKRVGTVLLAVLLLGLRFAYAQDVDRLMDRGQRLAAYGKLKAAEKTFKRVIEIKPDEAEAYYALAQIYEYEKRADEAELYYMAYLYLGAGEIEDPEAIRKAIKKAKRSVWRGAKVEVIAIPKEALIKVNGLPVGKGKVELVLLPKKRYKFRAELIDHKPAELELRFEEREKRTVKLKCQKITYYGTLEFSIEPPGNVEIYIDARPVGKDLKKYKVPEGRHLVCLKKPGYNRWWRFYTVRRNETTKVEAVMSEQDRPEEPCDVMPEEE